MILSDQPTVQVESRGESTVLFFGETPYKQPYYPLSKMAVTKILCYGVKVRVREVT